MAYDTTTDTQTLREAMKGFGTNDDKLIGVLATRTADQVQAIRAKYKADFGRDLLDDIRSETSGDYCRALVGLVYTPAEFDAKQLNRALTGVGTDEQCLMEVLCHRSKADIDAIKVAYQQRFGNALDYHITEDTSGLVKKLFLALVNGQRYDGEVPREQLAQDASTLHNAGEGKLGTDEEVFVDVVCKYGPKNLKALDEEYARQHGSTLLLAVGKEMGGVLEASLQAMIQDHDEFYADVIHNCMEGAGTNELRLIRALVGRRHALDGINAKYLDKYNCSLKGALAKELGGDFEKVLVKLVERF